MYYPLVPSSMHPAIQLKYMYSTLLLALLFGCVCLRHNRTLMLNKHFHMGTTVENDYALKLYNCAKVLISEN